MIGAAGYTLVAGPFTDATLGAVREAIVTACEQGDDDDVHLGSTSVRVSGMLRLVPALGALLDHEPLLDAVATIVGGPFRLSSLHARSVRPCAAEQALHQDVRPGSEAWPLAGFILMLDAFSAQNGATRFVPGSGGRGEIPDDQLGRGAREMQACGPAGALIVFDGSTWHGHGANTTKAWRHSIQGAFVPRAATPAVDFERTIPIEVMRGLPVRALDLLRTSPQRPA